MPALYHQRQASMETTVYKNIFASSKDGREPDGRLHTNFSLNRTHDQIYLTHPSGESIDKEAAEYAALRINEIMTMNVSTLRDEDGEYPNWVELHNDGEKDLNLEGFGLSDRDDQLHRWTFPAVIIEPGEFLVVFVSGKDRYDLDRGIFHTNFSISALGEPVVLSDRLGRVTERAFGGWMPADVSFGRNSKAEAMEPEWVYFTEPTPGAFNYESGYQGFTKPPRFSVHPGFYEEPIQLEITSPHPEIRYTLDGSIPTADSPRYSGPIMIDKTTLVRAKTFEERKLPGHDTVQTYFIRETHTLPVLSLAVDPRDFERIHSMGPRASSEFPHFGANFWQDIEVLAHFSMFETNGRLAFRIRCGFKIFGAYGRAMPQKSFAIYARNTYEYDEMTYPFLENKPLLNFKHLVLRTSGQDASFSKIRDIMMTSLMEDYEADIQGYRQTVLYINGRYWGIYNIREKINTHYLASNHGVDPDNVDLLEGNAQHPSFFKAGDNEHYNAMLDYISRNNMNDPDNYAYIQSILDIESFADFHIASMYFAQTDNGNIRFWRERSEEGKWRWILYDLDWAMWQDPSHDTVGHIINPQGTGIGRMFSTRLIRGLLSNDEFKQFYVERFAHHMNLTFHPDRIIERIDTLAANIETEMPRSIQRWPSPSSMDNWRMHVERLRNFARRRPAHLVRQIQRHFRLSDSEMQIFDAWRAQ